MPSGSDSMSPSGDARDRSSTGIRGPYQIPVDDDEREIDVADATIVDLEDGFSFFGMARTTIEEPAEQLDVAVDDSSVTHMREAWPARNWLAEHGES
jgi:hypothetical protein